MRFLTSAVLAATVAAGVAISAPAWAITFADYSATSTFNNIEWSENGTSGVLSARSAVNFEFLTPSLVGLGSLPADFIYKGVGPSVDPALAAAGYLIQPDLTGRFQFVYTGAPVVIGAKTLSSGDVLLRGSFTGAQIVGQNGSSAGNVNDATLAGGTIDFHSPFLGFGSGAKSYSIEMTSIADPLAVGSGGALNSFGAVSTGSFEAAISGGGPQLGTPEPASWALMTIGFASLGCALRARRRALAVG